MTRNAAPDSAPNGQNAAQPNAQPNVDPQQPSTPPSSVPIIPPGYVDQATVQTQIEAARREEKTKLYGEQKKLQERVTELSSQLASRQTPDERLQAQLSEVQRQLAETNAKMVEVQTQAERDRAQFAQQTTQLRLDSYLQRRLREERERGTRMMIELVGGSSEAEIDASIEVAKAEHLRLKEQFRQEIQAEQPAPVVPHVSAVPGMPVATVHVPLPPSAFPTAPNGSAVPTVESGTVEFAANVKELTSPESIRNGAYAQQRTRLLGQIKQQPAPNGPLSNAPRTLGMPTNSFGTVTQPQGHPTGPVQPHGMQSASPAPLPSPTVTVQPPGANGMMPPASVAPNGQPAQGFAPPAPAPAGDPMAAARATAIASATSALANPAHAGRAQVIGPRPKQHAEYSSGAPLQNPDFGAGHPMARNT